MTTIRWKSGAVPIAQVQEYVFGGTWETTDVITLTIGNKVVSTTAGSVVTATVVSALVTTFNAISATYYPEFADITATANSATFILTADDRGVPFICTIATTETGGGAADAQTIDGAASSAGASTTACSGPNHWDTAKNWDTGAVPVNADDVILENNTTSIKYGLAQSAVTLASLTVNASFSGSIGLPEINTEGDNAYPEYRATYLAISATTCTIGRGDGSGSGQMKLNFGSVQTALDVQSTGSPTEADLPALIWKGTNASNTVNVSSGSVGIAQYAGEVATVLTLRVSGDAVLACGPGVVTLTTLNMDGGTVTLYAGLTTVAKNGGTLTCWAGNITTLTDDDGTTSYLGVGTIATLNVGTDATMTFSPENRGTLAGCIVTNANFYGGSTILDPFGRVTWSNPPRLVRCRNTEVTFDFGNGKTLLPGA